MEVSDATCAAMGLATVWGKLAGRDTIHSCLSSTCLSAAWGLAGANVACHPHKPTEARESPANTHICFAGSVHPTSAQNSSWSCLHSTGTSFKVQGNFLIISLTEEEALVQIQTSPLGISLRETAICEQNENQVLLRTAFL